MASAVAGNVGLLDLAPSPRPHTHSDNENVRHGHCISLGAPSLSVSGSGRGLPAHRGFANSFALATQSLRAMSDMIWVYRFKFSS